VSVLAVMARQRSRDQDSLRSLVLRGPRPQGPFWTLWASWSRPPKMGEGEGRPLADGHSLIPTDTRVGQARRIKAGSLMVLRPTL